jgi:PKHD-type hydroxylase
MFKYTTVKNFLTKDECDSIMKYSLANYELKNATVRGDLVPDKKSRVSDVAFINYDDKFSFMNDRFKELLFPIINIKGHELNFENNIYQFTEYKVGEFYDWHIDVGIQDNQKTRYCSTVIQLNNDYDGGELQLKPDGDGILTLEKGVGNLFVFLSSMIHKVAPVTNGTRYSLVNWFQTKPIENYKKTLI